MADVLVSRTGPAVEIQEPAGADRVLEQTPQTPHPQILDPENVCWETAGFHRILGGYLYQWNLAIIGIFLGIVLFGWVVPRYVLPYPEIIGYYNIVQGLLLWAFAVTELGLSQALIKFVSANWDTQPRKALHYVQIFWWYRLFSSSALVTAITFIVVFVIPQTSYAYLAGFIIVYALFPLPSTLNVGLLTLTGMQHNDKAEKVKFIRGFILKFAAVVGCTLTGYFLGRADPATGELVGMTTGYLVGTYLDWGLGFLWSGRYLKTILERHNPPFTLRDAFGRDFTRGEAKEMIRFGINAAGSDLLTKASAMVLTFTWILVIPAYNSWIGLATVALVIGNLVSIPVVLAHNTGPAVSEALEAGRADQAGIYFSNATKFLFNFSLLNFLEIVVIVPPVATVIFDIVGSQYAGVLTLLPFMALFKLVEPFSILADQVLLGANRPRKYFYATIVQRGLDLATVAIFIPLFAWSGLPFPLLLGLWFFPGLAASLVIKWRWLKALFPETLSAKKFLGLPLLAGLLAIGLFAPSFLLFNFLLAGLGWIVALGAFIPLGAIVFPNLYYVASGFVGAVDDHDLFLLNSCLGLSGPSKKRVLSMIKYLVIGRRLSHRLQGKKRRSNKIPSSPRIDYSPIRKIVRQFPAEGSFSGRASPSTAPVNFILEGRLLGFHGNCLPDYSAYVTFRRLDQVG